MPKSGDNALERLTKNDWFKIGKKTAPVFTSDEEWLFRRVESIEFVDRRSVKRTVTVSFNKTKALPSLRNYAPRGTHLVPIAMIQKWPPTMDFELEDAESTMLARYTGTATKELDFGLLMGMVDESLRGTRGEITDRLRRELAEIVEDPQPSQDDVTRVVNELNAQLEDNRTKKISSQRIFAGGEDPVAATIDLAARLSGGSILWVAVPGKANADRVVKFSYLGAHLIKSPKFTGDRGQSELKVSRRQRILTQFRRLAVNLSWRGRTLVIPLLHGGQGVRYHLNICAPAGNVELQDVTALALPAAQPSGYRTYEPRSLSVATLAAKYPELLARPDEWVGPESSGYFMDYGSPILLASTSEKVRAGGYAASMPADASAEIIDRRAHVNFGADGAPSHRALLQLKLKGAREGLVQRCALAAAVITLLMWVIYPWLEQATRYLEATVVLLALVPVVLAYAVVNPDEQPFEHEHLVGVRLLALLSGALPIAGALTLILAHEQTAKWPPEVSTDKHIWLGLAGLSAFLLALLVVSLACSAPSKPRAEPTPKQRP